jgi:hypothetical protein
MGGCPVALIPLAAADRSIGLCTDAALYMQLLGAWIVPGDPEAAQSTLQKTTKCLAGMQQQAAGIAKHMGLRQASSAAAIGVARHASAASAGSSGTTTAAAGAAVLFLEPLYESWLQWLQARPAVVAVYAPNFEQVNMLAQCSVHTISLQSTVLYRYGTCVWNVRLGSSAYALPCFSISACDCVWNWRHYHAQYANRRSKPSMRVACNACVVTVCRCLGMTGRPTCACSSCSARCTAARSSCSST